MQATPNAVQVWDFWTHVCERTVKLHNWDVKCVAWHPHKSIAVSGALRQRGSISASLSRTNLGGKDRAVKLWDPSDGRELFSFNGHTEMVRRRCVEICGGG